MLWRNDALLSVADDGNHRKRVCLLHWPEISQSTYITDLLLVTADLEVDRPFASSFNRAFFVVRPDATSMKDFLRSPPALLGGLSK